MVATITPPTGLPAPIRLTRYLGAPEDHRPWQDPAFAVAWTSVELAPYGIFAEHWNVPAPALDGAYRLTVVVHDERDGHEVHAADASPSGPPLTLQD